MRTLSITLALCLLLTCPVKAAGREDVVYSWHNSGKRIALTFDDGPHPTQTGEILEILAQYGVKATFFVIGQNVKWYGECLEDVCRAGHEIGNHTATHAGLTNAGYDAVCREIDEGERLIEERVEVRPHLLRPPGGILSDDLYRAAQERDYTLVCWSVDTMDWAHTPPEVIAENVLSHIDGGDIILFHDYVSGQSPTPAALRLLLPRLIERGYQLVTVSELIGG